LRLVKRSRKGRRQWRILAKKNRDPRPKMKGRGQSSRNGASSCVAAEGFAVFLAAGMVKKSVP